MDAAQPISAHHVGAVLDDRSDGGQGFDVVDDRRPAEQALHSRERRLDARPAALAFDAFEQAGFFAADVRPCASDAGSIRRRSYALPLIKPCLPKIPFAYASSIAFCMTLAWWRYSPRMKKYAVSSRQA